MDTQNIGNENIKTPEKGVDAGEQKVSFNKEAEPQREIKEVSLEDKMVSEELRKEIELMEIDPNLKKDAEEKANKIRVLADDDKLKKLLEVAREKGVVYAVKVAKEMNEPYLLDLFHDMLAKEGYYKNFVKE